MKFINKSQLRSILIYTVSLLVAFVVLFMNMKVHPQGVPYYHVAKDRHIGGPFESSGSTSRYALTESIVTQGKLYFNKEAAGFASPDVSGGGGKYFSLFAPGVSFLAIPFYYIGMASGYEQFTTYLLNIVFAILSAILIMLILKRFGYSMVMQIITAFIFLFATNAFVYSLHLTQHLVGAFLVLSSIYITTFWPSLVTNLLLGIVFGIGIMVDIPNAFMLIPAVIYYGFRQINVSKIKEKVKISLKTVIIFMLVGLVPLIILFGWYNKELTGSPTILPQFVGRVGDINSQEREDKREATAIVEQRKAAEKFGGDSPFQSRFIMNGLYILLISDERGWLYYSPILLIGFLGIYLIYKKEGSQDMLFVPVSIFLINTLLYAMFGDPWGGWSFGARYMIPAAAAMVLFIPAVLVKFRKNIILTLLVCAVIVYSIFINTLGAATTTEVPPKQEAIHLTTEVPYTYEYNFQLLDKNLTYAMFNTYFFKSVPARTTWLYESILLSLIVVLPILYLSGRELLVKFKKK